MIARQLLLVLVILNLSAAAWWLFHRDRAAAATTGAAAIPALKLAEAAPAVAAAQTATLPADAVCASFGPFADAMSAEQARQQLRTQAIRIDARQVVQGGQTQFWLDVAAAAGFDPASVRGAVHAARAERVACPATSG